MSRELSPAQLCRVLALKEALQVIKRPLMRRYVVFVELKY